MTRPGDHGFTLLEILVALVIFGLVLAGLTQGARSMFAAWDRQTRTIDVRGERDAIERTLRSLIEQLEPQAPVDGHPHSLGFRSELPLSDALPNRLADLLLMVDAQHRLKLRWAAHIHADLFGPAPSPGDIDLLDGVSGVVFGYWSGKGGGGWQDEWSDEVPPALIRIRVLFPAGDGRHWADIVASPMRARAGR